MNNTIEYLKALYNALRTTKGDSFNYNDYMWVLGTAILDELKINDFYKVIKTTGPIFLFGIEVEIDYSNIYKVQLFEDITNKIHIDPDGNDYSTHFGYAR